MLTSDLAAEVSRAGAAEGVLTSDLAAEVSRAGAAESSLASSIAAEASRATAAEGVLTSDLAAEESRAMAAEAALDARVDVLEAIAHEKQKITLVAGDITNGYIDLAQAAIAKSTVITVALLAIHEGEDYTVSVVSGKTRITFIGSMIGSGVEALVAGDEVFVKYMY